MKNVDINWPVQKLRFDEAMTGARVDPAAGKLLDAARLIRPTDLVDAYYAGVPDPSQASQRVHFGTSGHRGSALRASFNEPHIIAIAQSICLYRKRQGIDGPLFLGIDTHALSRPAFETALEVFVANDVVTMIDGDDGYMLWDKQRGQVGRVVVFGRGIAILAGGDAKPRDKTITFTAKAGDRNYGILQNTYLSERAELKRFESTFALNDDGTFSYEQTLVLKLAALDGKEMDHTDKNTLHLVKRFHPSSELAAIREI